MDLSLEAKTHKDGKATIDPGLGRGDTSIAGGSRNHCPRQRDRPELEGLDRHAVRCTGHATDGGHYLQIPFSSLP